MQSAIPQNSSPAIWHLLLSIEEPHKYNENEEWKIAELHNRDKEAERFMIVFEYLDNTFLPDLLPSAEIIAEQWVDLVNSKDLRSARTAAFYAKYHNSLPHFNVAQSTFSAYCTRDYAVSGRLANIVGWPNPSYHVGIAIQQFNTEKHLKELLKRLNAV